MLFFRSCMHCESPQIFHFFTTVVLFKVSMIYYLLTSDCIRMGYTTNTTRSAISCTLEWLNCSESGSTLIPQRTILTLDFVQNHDVMRSTVVSLRPSAGNFMTLQPAPCFLVQIVGHVPRYKNPWTWHVDSSIIINLTIWHEHKVVPESRKHPHSKDLYKHHLIYQVKIVMVTTFIHL